jgi:hypothetical protein
VNARPDCIPEGKTPSANRELADGAAASDSQSVTDLGKHFTTELTNRSRRVP